MQFWEARRPQTMLNTWGYSGMGFGPSAIMGAKLARPDVPCVAICGDGGFTMVPHVLCTAVEYDIPVVWVVWNNRSEEHTSELQSLMRISYAVFCLKKKTNLTNKHKSDRNRHSQHT